MSTTVFKLIDLPDYQYPEGAACPECYAPTSRNRRDARCDVCLHDKKLLPVNYRRRPKKKVDEDEDPSYEEDEERPRRSRKRERD
jgi:hypothetical protein